MTPAGMLELAERVEQASGPDRELDAEVALAVTGNTAELSEGGNMIWCGGGHSVLADLPAVPWSSRWIQVAHYTASLDAALTLVPDGHSWAAGDCGENDGPWACVTAHEEPCADYPGAAGTVILSVLAAALRARAEEGRDGG